MSKISVTEANLDIIAISAGLSAGLTNTRPSHIGTENESGS